MSFRHSAAIILWPILLLSSFSNVFAQSTPRTVYQINCGGSTSSPYTADQYSSGGYTAAVSNSIDPSAASNPAPQSVYQSVRYGGNFSYVLPGLTAGAAYTVRLHFSENYWTVAGGRNFNVAINGATVLTNFDAFVAAGGQCKATARQFGAIADSSGQVTIQFSPGTTGQDQTAIVCGLDLSAGGLAPAAPANPNAVAGNAMVQLTWSNSASASSYTVKRTTVSGGPYTAVGSAIVGTSYVDATAANGTAYYYVVTASNATGESTPSTEVSATSSASAFSTPHYAAGFSGATDVVLNGGAAITAGNLRLTDGGGGEARSAFFNFPVNIASFSTDFVLQLTNANADGCAFVIQNTGPGALGSGANGFGCFGIPNRVAVKFKLYDNVGEGPDTTGLYDDNTAVITPAIDLRSTGIDLHSGHPLEVRMNYDGQTLKVTLTDTITGITATQSYIVDIPGSVGSSTAYVGFSGGTGGLSAIQDVTTWTWGDSTGSNGGGLTESGQSVIYQVNVGGGAAAPYLQDPLPLAGTALVGNPIDLSGVTNPAPLAVYQSVRGGNFSYVFPGLTPNAQYTVRLHFSENYWSGARSRSFNVAVNGSPVLTNFDIFAAAGAQFKAVAKHFNVVADSAGHITIQTSSGTVGPDHNPCISGIEILNGDSAPDLPTALSAAGGNAQVVLSWTGSVGAASYTIKRSVTSGGPYSVVASAIAGTSYTDTTPTNLTTYYYVVTALNSGGESGLSNEANATPTSVAGNGIGLTGQYYNGTAFNTLMVTRTDPYVDFEWTNEYPAPGLGTQNFSVRWTGQVQPKYNGTYTFYTTTNGGGRLWVNGQLLIDDSGLTENSGTILLAAGLKYDIKLEYYHGYSGSRDRLSWSSPVQKKQVVPQAQLYPPGTNVPMPFPPIQLSVFPNKDGTLALSWTAYPGSLYYNVYRATYSGQETFYRTGLNGATFLDVDADNGTGYYYQVAAVTLSAMSPLSNEGSGTPTNFSGLGAQGSGGGSLPPPAAPDNLQGVCLHGRVFLTWDRTADDNGHYTDICYRVYRYDGTGGYQLIADGMTTPSYVDPNVTNGVTYQYYVTMVNGNGPSLGSPIATVPVDVTVANPHTVPGDGQAILTWDTNPDADYYQVYKWFPNADGTGYFYLLADSIAATNYTATGLSVNTPYQFSVRAVNHAGPGSFCAAIALTLPLIAPQNLQCSPGDGAATVTWDAVSGADYYNLYRWVPWNGTGYYSLVGTTSTLSCADTSRQLIINTPYQYVVCAGNIGGLGPFSDPVSLTLTLAAPQNLILEADGNQVTLNWDVVANADSYQVWMGYPDTDMFFPVGTAPGATWLQSHLGLNTQYFFEVQATNRGGNGPFSAPAYITPSSLSGLSLRAKAAEVSVSPGKSGVSTIIVTGPGTLTGTLDLTVTGAPEGVTCWLSPSASTLSSPPVAGMINKSLATLYICVSGSTLAGTYPLTVTGSVGSATGSATVTLVIPSTTAHALPRVPPAFGALSGIKPGIRLAVLLMGPSRAPVARTDTRTMPQRGFIR